MTFTAALRTFLSENWTLAGLVPIERIVPVVAPKRPTEEQQPYQDCIVYSLDNRSVQLSDLDGQGPVETTWEITVYSGDYDRCYEISDALISALNFYQGTIPASGDVSVQSCTMQGCSDDYDLELRAYLIRHSFEIVYVP